MDRRAKRHSTARLRDNWSACESALRSGASKAGGLAGKDCAMKKHDEAKQADDPGGASLVSFPSIVCRDGASLAGKLFEPKVAPRLAIVIHGGTGTPRDYYGPFAQWLSASRSAAVLIYDYREFGHSATGPVRRAKATMAQWGVVDQGAALDYVCRRFPKIPIEVIGHSLGGMFFAFHRNAPRVRCFTAVASGPAHWTRHPLSYTPKVLAFWFLGGPLLTATLGYMPGRTIGLGSDIPAGVYWQWRRWCVSRQFHRGDWGKDLPIPDLESVKGPVRLISIADDVVIPPGVVEDLAQFYPHAQIENKVISPADIGVAAIGHTGIFAERSRSAWPLLLSP